MHQNIIKHAHLEGYIWSAHLYTNMYMYLYVLYMSHSGQNAWIYRLVRLKSHTLAQLS